MAESPVEKLFREAAAGLWPDDHPLVQEHPVTVEGRRYRIDFAIPTLTPPLAIELESFEWHSRLGPDKVTEDKARERALTRAGWRVVSFTGKEVTANPGAVVREALKTAGLEAKALSHCPTCRCGEPDRIAPEVVEALKGREPGLYRVLPTKIETGGRGGFDFPWPRPSEQQPPTACLTCDGPHTCPRCPDEGQAQLEECMAKYRDRLWQCRKLCLRALTYDYAFDGGGYAPRGVFDTAFTRFHLKADAVFLQAFDEAGCWDRYEHRYLYTNCVEHLVVTGSNCEHTRAEGGADLGGCHCTPGRDCPNNCGHQWWKCAHCGIKFPLIGQEQAWLDCDTCGTHG